jgi:hypothetical protein
MWVEETPPKEPWWIEVARFLRGRPTADPAIVVVAFGLAYLGKLFLDVDGDLTRFRFIGGVLVVLVRVSSDFGALSWGRNRGF